MNCDAVTVWLRTSGGVNALESSTWTTYVAAFATSFQSSVTGCAGRAAFAGLRRLGVLGAGGGDELGMTVRFAD